MSDTVRTAVTAGASVALIALLATTSAAGDPPVPALVKGRVKTVEKEKWGTDARVEVTHVYSGPGDLLGRTFGDAQRQEDWNGRSARVPFEVGEEGLWTVCGFKGELTVGQQPERSGWPVWIRCRVKEECAGRKDSFAAVEAVAEAIEKVDQAKPGERFGLLREYSASKNRAMVYWAMNALGNLKEDEADEFLGELAAKDDAALPISTQIVLDEVLAHRKGIDWTDSKRRVAMLRAWVREKRSKDDGNDILTRIYHAHQDQTLSDKLAVELTTTAAGNPKWPAASRREGFSQVRFAALRSVNDEARATAFEWMFGQMQNNDDLEQRRWAASLIDYSFALYPARLKAIEEHLATEKDDKVAASLRAAVKKAKEMK